MKALLVFLLIFSVVVIVHEFGHFYFAKRAGILVREFSIGMGPKILAHQGKDGTMYTIRLLPLGGYVRMAGLEEEEELQPGMPVTIVVNQTNEVIKINKSKKVTLTDGLPIELIAYDLTDDLTITGYLNGDETVEKTFSVTTKATIIEEDGTELRIAPRNVRFQSAKLWERMLTNFAGPLNNFILAFLLFTLYVFIQGGVPNSQSTTISHVGPASPAAKVGMQAGDTVQKINQQAITNWPELMKAVQENQAKQMEVTYQREGKVKTVLVTPTKTGMKGQTMYQIGVGVPMKTGVWDKVVGGFTMTRNGFTQIFSALGSLLTNFSLNKLGGPVAIYQISSQAASQGTLTIIGVMAMISINLGIFNLLPIPALDGGKLVLNMIEGLRGKPLSQDKEGLITLIGFGFMMLLMILVTWNDIQRFFF